MRLLWSIINRSHNPLFYFLIVVCMAVLMIQYWVYNQSTF